MCDARFACVWHGAMGFMSIQRMMLCVCLLCLDVSRYVAFGRVIKGLDLLKQVSPPIFLLHFRTRRPLCHANRYIL